VDALLTPCPQTRAAESGVADPFLWIEGSSVEVWALVSERFSVRAPDHE
jgi:hypothetical protein